MRTHSLDVTEIRRRAAKLLDDAGMQKCASLDDVVAMTTEIHGKPIDIQVTDDPTYQSLSAVWIDFPEFATVIVRAKDRPVFRVRGIGHELGHILHGHTGCHLTAAALTPQEQEAFNRFTRQGAIVRGRVSASRLNRHAPDPDFVRAEVEAEQTGVLIVRHLLIASHLADKAFG
ncbi:hypothetical protein [Rathayibacter sp. VKM Ac-2754]|uniref:hypothetical protein n=1 Tax=Rathayibacter sp. VKM Ac-2754 TaxID=2609251 RepID=UPI001356FF58|nr:hypothetical protein [Rathayibacter sp. VKM Ac-2754]MWV60850.1 hypothetical protein [Rathayibacter sp. VKM Ac-2754]